MDKIWELSPEELFFLGKHMRAKYIDYDYVKMMGDICQQYSFKEKNIMSGLGKKGYLTEDFLGNIILNESIKSALETVFFGNFESSVLFGIVGEKEISGHYKFHFFNKKVVQVEVKGKSLIIDADGICAMNKIEKIVIPDSYKVENIGSLDLEKMDVIQAEEWMILKNMNVNKSSYSSQFLKMNGSWYVGKEENSVDGLTVSDLKQRWAQILRGNMTDGIL